MEEEILKEELILAYSSTYQYSMSMKNIFYKLLNFFFKRKNKRLFVIDDMIRLHFIDEYLTAICKQLEYHHLLCKYMEYNGVRIGCGEEVLNIVRSLFYTEIKHGEEFVAVRWRFKESFLLDGLAARVRKKTIDIILKDL